MPSFNTIDNGDSGLVVRTILNDVINYVNTGITSGSSFTYITEDTTPSSEELTINVTDGTNVGEIKTQPTQIQSSVGDFTTDTSYHQIVPQGQYLAVYNSTSTADEVYIDINGSSGTDAHYLTLNQNSLSGSIQNNMYLGNGGGIFTDEITIKSENQTTGENSSIGLLTNNITLLSTDGALSNTSFYIYPTGSDLTTSSNGFTSTVALDPEGLFNGSRLYATDGTSEGYIQWDYLQHYFSITDGTNTTDFDMSGGGSGNFVATDNSIATKSALELDPAESNLGTRFYVEDTSNEQLTQLYINKEYSQLQTLDSNFAIYNSVVGTNFVPGGIGNDKVNWGLQAINLVGSSFADITGEVDLVTDESQITIVADELTISPGIVYLIGIPTYADNAAALTGGLTTDAVYKTSTGELRIVI